MSIRLRSGTGDQTVPQGTYEAVITKVEEASSEKGPYLKWHFDALVSGEAKSIVGVSAMTLDPGSRTRIWVENLCGRSLATNEEIDLDRLVGRGCKIEVSINTLNDGRRLPRIDKVLKTGVVLSAKAAPRLTPSTEEPDSPAIF